MAAGVALERPHVFADYVGLPTVHAEEPSPPDVAADAKAVAGATVAGAGEPLPQFIPGGHELKFSNDAEAADAETDAAPEAATGAIVPSAVPHPGDAVPPVVVEQAAAAPDAKPGAKQQVIKIGRAHV